ncbi:MAG: carbohydrate ABC transporter permease [Nocardioidaceae bacterium]
MVRATSASRGDAATLTRRGTPTPTGRGLRRRRRRNPGGWGFVTPAVLFLLLLNTFPLIFSVVLSLNNVSLQNGLRFGNFTTRNWTFLLHDGGFWGSITFTVIFTVASVAVEYVIGFSLALLLWREIKGGAFFRVLFAIPMMLAPVTIGFMWRMLYDQSYGPINAILRSLHLGSPPWLSDSQLAVVSAVIMHVWEWTPLMFLLILAGLQGIPKEVVEAAHLDGATGLRLVARIIFPILAPVSVMAVFLRAIDSFRVFGQLFLLTGGGPGNATTSTTLFAFFQGFQSFNISYGATIAVALLVVVLIIGLIYLGVTRRLLRRVET